MPVLPMLPGTMKEMGEVQFGWKWDEKLEFKHLQLKEKLMCLKDKKVDLRTGHWFMFF